LKSLSGFWAGTYWYPDPQYPAVNFDCEFKSDRGTLTGHITEIDIFKPSRRFLLSAKLIGSIIKREVTFLKTYENAGEHYRTPVQYTGKIGLMGRRISGTWDVGVWSGRFVMYRDKGHWRVADTVSIANDRQKTESV